MAGTTGTRTESARRGKERLPDCIRRQPAAREAGRARRGGARRTVGPALRQAELCRCGPLAETARTAMAAGSAPGWAVGALGVVCLFLKLGEWRPPPGAHGDREREVSVAPGLRARWTSAAQGGCKLGWRRWRGARARDLVVSSTNHRRVIS